jgi:hypothetical protein
MMHLGLEGQKLFRDQLGYEVANVRFDCDRIRSGLLSEFPHNSVDRQSQLQSPPHISASCVEKPQDVAFEIENDSALRIDDRWKTGISG